MRLIKSFALAGALALAFAAPAAHAYDSGAILRMPATLGLAVGDFDALKNNPRKQSVDFRVEYRTAYDMLGIGRNVGIMDLRNDWMEIRPFFGVETNTDGFFYGQGGFVFDIPLGKHFALSPNLAVGLYDQGNSKHLGSVVEFRSTAEVDYVFDDASRLGVSFGHISNAGLTDSNHGVEIADVYYHLPIDKIFGAAK